MRLQSWLPSLAASLCLGTVLAEPIPRQESGSFSLLKDEPLFTFEYSVAKADSTNWIGIYHAEGGGPVNEEQDEDSLTWEYTPDTEGTVRVSADGLQPGSYKAFFLASDGYKWLAEPLDVELPETGTFEFVVSSITLQNARQGDSFAASISGLLVGKGSEDAEYTIASSSEADWAEMSSSGNITGTPSSSTNAKLNIEAKSGDSTAELEVTIPVRSESESLVEELLVMSYNLWHGGSRVNDYHKKQVKFLAESNADIVGVQESTPDHATRLGRALGWYVWQDTDVGVISRYPIDHVYDRLGSYSGGIRVNLDGQCSQLNLWNVHLGYDPYGPYDFCFDGMTVDEVMEREEESGRTPQIIETLEAMEEQLSNSDDVPVILLGDFNSPSHLDWTKALEEKNCGYSDVMWPSSEVPIEAGMEDSFRQAHPDPAETEGITWSPIFLENEGRPEPLDRIDFIYHKSDFEVVSSETLVVGDPKAEPNHEDNEWTSDHAAVLTTFKLSSSRCS
ncbi:endonuclease/exonuclease/phosphatase family [Sarocladium strictum]